MKPSFFARHSRTILLVMVFLLPFIGIGALRALRSNRNDVKDWLPDNFLETKTHRWFEEHFPHEQFVLASWEGCTLDDQRLELLAKKLVPPKPAKYSTGEPQFFKSVITGRRLVDDLKARYPTLSEEEVLKRLEGSLIGEDHYKTCLVVTLTKEANGRNLRAALERIRSLARQCNIEPPKKEVSSNFLVRLCHGVGQTLQEMIFGREPQRGGIHLGGPPVDNVAIDVEGERTLYRLAGLSAIVGLGISWLCLRSFRLTFLVFFVALLAAGVGLASVFFSGSTVDAVLLSMPSLVYVLAMSGAVHIINYYHDAVRNRGLERAPERALRHGMVPCTLAAFTTALGLGSLIASHLIPINKFGIYSAWGVMATLGLLFLYLPACLYYLPSREYLKGGAKNPDGRPQPSVFTRFWHHVGEFIVRHNLLVATGCLLIMALFALGLCGSKTLGLPGIQTSVKLMKLFSPDAQIIYDYAWLEDQLGPLVPMEVVISVDNQKCKLSMVDRMRLAQHVEQAVEQLGDVGGALSAATFAPDIAPMTSKGGVLEKIVGLNRRREWDRQLSIILEQHREQFHEYLTVDKEIAVADEQSDPTLAQLGIDGETAGLLEAKRLNTLQAVEHYGNLESVRGLTARQAAAVTRAIDAWRAAHHDPTLEELGITGELAGRLRARGLGTLLAIEGCGTQGPVEKNLASMRGIAPEGAAQVARAIDQWRSAHGEELWRVSARVKALGDLDYGLFVDQLKKRVEPVLAAYREHGVEGIDATYTGLVPLVYKAQRELLHGLYNSLKWAFVLIALVMMVLLRSPSAGLLAMIPNIFPVVVIFGAMAWLRILVDVGTMMTASVALGVAVDDTIHFLTWFRRGLDEGHDRKGAVMLAYERCATAMTQTTLIGGLGLSVFAFSTFTPTQRFGVLMLTLLGAALFGDLVLNPALLSGPLGRCFRASRKKRPDEPPPEDTAGRVSDEEVVAVPMAGRSGTGSPSGTHQPEGGRTRHLRREPPHRSTKAS
jgi:predicted RND superfamily exporter protein